MTRGRRGEDCGENRLDSGHVPVVGDDDQFEPVVGVSVNGSEEICLQSCGVENVKQQQASDTTG